jgi:hypothetical protein
MKIHPAFPFAVAALTTSGCCIAVTAFQPSFVVAGPRVACYIIPETQILSDTVEDEQAELDNQAIQINPNADRDKDDDDDPDDDPDDDAL